MALTQQQKDELVNSGILKNYVNKSWDEIENYAPMKEAYTTAKSNNDYQGMQQANDLANAIRKVQGLPEQKATVDINNIKSLVENQQVTSNAQVQPVQQAQSNSGMINSQYDNLISAIKAQIQQSINNKQQQINQLPQKYQPMKDNSEVQKAQELRTVLEQNANAGDRGGIGRQNALETQTAGDNRLNSINLQQSNEADNLRNDIANLALEGDIQGAQLAAQRLRDLIENNRYVDETNYNRGQDSFRNNLTLDQFNYQKQQGAIDNQFRQDQFNYQKQSDTADRAFREKQFDESIRQNNIAQENWQKQFTYQQIQDKIQNSLAAGRISMDKAQLALQQAKFASDQDPNSIDNQIKKLQLDMAKNSRIDDIRARAVQIATTNGYFDQDTYESILKALQGNTAGTGMQQKGLSIDDDLSQYFK